MGPIHRPKPTPVASFLPNIFQSMYRVNATNNMNVSGMAIVGSKGIGIIGCNMFAVLAQVGPPNSFKILNITPISTTSSCPIDNDQKLLS
jgi:hypothetical protein